MRLSRLSFAVCIAMALSLPGAAWAVSCTTESQMTPAERGVFEQAARRLGTEVQAGNAATVRADTVAAVASKFGSLASSIEAVAPEIQKATLTVDALYSLKATDIQAGAGSTEFFCAVPNSSLVVTVTIPGLPPGNYLLAVLHATGVKSPRQLSMILENDPVGSAEWKLAGLYIRPLMEAGRDGVWYWKQARDFTEKKQSWNAYFYYQTAAFLLNPVDFLSSPNLQKLEKEMESVKPADLPGKAPMTVRADGKSLEVTGLRTQTFQGGLDLVVDYKAQGVTGPVETRTQIVALMKALLALHPELRAGFHGLWVYAYSESGQPFAIELPVNQI